MENVRKRLSSEARKDTILNAACELFAENGYEKTSTKQLAGAAGCSEALLYKYFESKRAIMETLLDEWKAEQNREFKLTVIDQSALATLRSHYESFIFSVSKMNPAHSNMRHNLINALNSTPFYRQKAWEVFTNGSDMIKDTIVPVIELGQKQGEIRAGDPYMVANLFVGYMVGAREIAGNFPDRFTPVPFDFLVEMIF